MYVCCFQCVGVGVCAGRGEGLVRIVQAFDQLCQFETLP